MADARTTIFSDGLMEASVSAGVARLTLAQTGVDGKPFVAGQLIIPLVQMPAFAGALVNLLKQIEAKAKEAQAPVPVSALPTAAEPAPAPVPGAFRFGA